MKDDVAIEVQSQPGPISRGPFATCENNSPGITWRVLGLIATSVTGSPIYNAVENTVKYWCKIL